MLTRMESLPWHSPPTAVASYLGKKKKIPFFFRVFGQFGGYGICPKGLGAMGCFLCETQIFAPGNWMVGTLIVSFWGAMFRPSF